MDDPPTYSPFRILKHQVAQAGANLTGLASATLDSATHTGRPRGNTNDDDSAGEEEVVVGKGKRGDMWLGKHWQWDAPRREGVKRRSTHDDLHAAAAVAAPHEGHRHVSAELPRARTHRTRHSIHGRPKTPSTATGTAGGFKSMTSRTGHALRDGLSNVTNRRKHDESDSDTGRPSSMGTRRGERRSTTPVLVESETSRIFSRRHPDISVISTDYVDAPQISITATAPSDAASSQQSFGAHGFGPQGFEYRPSHTRSHSASHFADSEAVSEDFGGGFTSDGTRPFSRGKSPSAGGAGEEIPAPGSAETMVSSAGYAALSTRLERIVSMDARYGAVYPGRGIEFLHAGHGEGAWVAWKRARRRGLVRRQSYDSRPPAREIVRQHPKQLQVDVSACALAWRLIEEESRVRHEMEMMLEMETIMQRISIQFAEDYRARRQALDRIEASAAAIISPPSDEVDVDPAADAAPSTAVQAKRLLNKITADGRDLEYSVRNLQNTVRSIGDAGNKIDAWMAEFPSDGKDDSGPGMYEEGKAQALVRQLQGSGTGVEMPLDGEVPRREGAWSVARVQAWIAARWNR